MYAFDIDRVDPESAVDGDEEGDRYYPLGCPSREFVCAGKAMHYRRMKSTVNRYCMLGLCCLALTVTAALVATKPGMAIESTFTGTIPGDGLRIGSCHYAPPQATGTQ